MGHDGQTKNKDIGCYKSLCDLFAKDIWCSRIVLAVQTENYNA